MSDRLQQVLDELDSVAKLGEASSPGTAGRSAELTFEHPLNERIRTLLRLEHLLGKSAYFLSREDPWMSRAAIEGILDLLAVTARTDTKAEILKELARNIGILKRVQEGPEVDAQALQKLRDDLEQAAAEMHRLSGQIGQSLQQDGLLKEIAKCGGLPGGICGFDLPRYHHWLKQPSDLRQMQLHAWMQELQSLSKAVTLILSLARTSGTSDEVTAIGGLFQEAVDIQAPVQLVRIRLRDTDDHLFPEISGYRNHFSIRFMSIRETGQPVSWRQDTTFSLTRCAF
ncbi:MAG: cell division protein ZapD [Candidatus Thiosymbion ectosymbiont of Robbea hypermnestra]|nr:cell division protein ZapD [Candidatus Thiosymbion ectosymbiont of Robbea hypermnestra]